MATYTFGSVSGNWNDATKWSPSTNYPKAADTAIIASTSGTVTVNVTSACTTLTFQAAKTLTLGANLTVSGVTTFTGSCIVNGAFYLRTGGITLGSKGVANGTATLELAGNMTVPAMSFECNVNIVSGLITWGAGTNSFSRTLTYTGGTMSVNSAHICNMTSNSTISTAGMTWVTVTTAGGNITLGQNLYATTLQLFQSTTFVGAYNFYLTNLIYSGSTTTSLTASTTTGFVAGTTVNVSGNFFMHGNYPFTVGIYSTTASSAVNLTFTGLITNCRLHTALLTDVTATNIIRGVNITRTRCTNIYQYKNSDVLGSGAMLCHLN